MVFHVLNRANARHRIFEHADDYSAFERVMSDTVEHTAMRILSYCIMPNHWHMLLWPRRKGDLGAFMQRLTTTHVRRWHLYRDSVGMGHLYQGTYKSFPVEQDEHLLAVFRYVERNALRAELVDRAEARESRLDRNRIGSNPAFGNPWQALWHPGVAEENGKAVGPRVHLSPARPPPENSLENPGKKELIPTPIGNAKPRTIAYSTIPHLSPFFLAAYWTYPLFSGAPHDAAGSSAGVLAVLQNGHAVDQHVAHAGGILVRPVERGVIGDGRRVEHHDVGMVARRQTAAVLQTQVAGR
jgi:REP element-mobilizing transposase RayT